MLCGIGGRTIAEAQEALSAEELETWALYRAQRGTLNVGLRMELEFARIRCLLFNRWRADGRPEFELSEFLEHFDQPEEPEVDNVASFVQAFKARRHGD